jgi:tRNA(Ile)-lysidine synthase
MLQKLDKHITQNLPFLKDKKLLIAISGGIDSVVLTQLLSILNFDISLAHCNFKLRKIASDLDEDFVKKMAQKLDIACFTTQFKTQEFAKQNKQSTQVSARNLRYTWFDKLAEKHHFDYVLTAHHADDNLETFLINLTRGSGLDGFTGIPTINENIVRPFLIFSSDEILAFAKENKIDWREDKSNASTKYIRNKIRHQVLPVLKEINPSVIDTFSKTIENLQESKQIIDDRITIISSEVLIIDKKNIKIDVKKINQLSSPKAYLYQLLKAYNFTAWKDVYNLLSAQSGKQIFSKTHGLLKDRDFLIVSKRDFSNSLETRFKIEEHQTEITKPIHLTFENVAEKSIENNQTIYATKELLKFPLILRKWEDGDYFYPAGMHGKKKLSKYFKDEKLSLLEKEKTWLLCNNTNEIIWIIGMRLDNRFDVKSNATFKITLQ